MDKIINGENGVRIVSIRGVTEVWLDGHKLTYCVKAVEFRQDVDSINDWKPRCRITLEVGVDQFEYEGPVTTESKPS